MLGLRGVLLACRRLSSSQFTGPQLEALARLQGQGWTLDGPALHRDFHFRNFSQVLASEVHVHQSNFATNLRQISISFSK